MEQVKNKINEDIRSNSKTLNIVSSIIFVVFLIGMIIAKATVSSFPLAGFLIALGIGVFLYVGVIFGFKYFADKDKLKDLNKNGLKPAITKLEARKVAEEILSDKYYMDYFEKILEENVVELGKGVKSKIYYVYGQTEFDKKKIFICINMHDPLIKNSIMENPNNIEMETIKQRSASYPEEAPSIKDTEVSNPLTGVTVKTREVLHKDGEKEKDNKEELS